MGARATRQAIALSSVALLMSGIAGCSQPAPDDGSHQGKGPANAAPANLAIVEQVEIDEKGTPVRAESVAAPADPAGDGKAACAPVSIAMVGALNGPDAVLGINIKNGIQLAVDKHNAANPGCQIELKTFDTEGGTAEGHRDRAADHRRRRHHRTGRSGVLR